jgi:class 3 adenylate cyclase
MAMMCNACGDENRETARFCGSCAAPLVRAVVCDACGAELQGVKGLAGSGLRASGAALTPNPVTPSPLSYTPKHLADKILQSKSALEGERKQVTVLFADVKGSMELAEQVDPEEWHQILDRFFQIVTDGVHRFEGTINQYTGDGVMALSARPSPTKTTPSAPATRPCA